MLELVFVKKVRHGDKAYYYLVQSIRSGNEEPCGKPQGINIHIPTTTAATLWQATGYSQNKTSHRTIKRLTAEEANDPEFVDLFSERKPLVKLVFTGFNSSCW